MSNRDSTAGWEYLEPDGNTSDDRQTLSLKQPRTAVSKLIPAVEYDAEEKTLSLTFRS